MAGVGNTSIKFVVDDPCGLSGINTVVRFTVLEDGRQRIPALVSVDCLRDHDADIKLRRKTGDSIVMHDSLGKKHHEDLVRERTGNVS